jgi:hypothetical protein
VCSPTIRSTASALVGTSTSTGRSRPIWTGAGEVEITFTEVAPERTRVVLTHRHLDLHGEGGVGMRDAIGSGWTLTPLAELIDQAKHVGGHVLPIISDDVMRACRAATSI